MNRGSVGTLVMTGLLLSGCITARAPAPYFEFDETYSLLSVDESMSCDALNASFMFSARRAARLQFWLETGPVAGYGHARFGLDAPPKLREEFKRMDALSDQQRYKGCRVLEPQLVVAEERARLGPLPPPLISGPVLRSKG